MVLIYGGAVVLVTALTTLYTAAGGIRAVVWTDVIQASVMGGAVIYALVSLWFGVGGWAGAQKVLTQPDDLKIFATGVDATKGVVANIYAVLGSEYTIFAALLGSVFTTMATHGTDQDMVQRMLTAKDYHRSRLALVLSGIADIPIAMGFLFIGVLLAVFYQLHPDAHLPVKNPEIFAYYILHQLPPGARGLLIAGVLATAMGSLSTGAECAGDEFHGGFLGALFWQGRGRAPDGDGGAVEHGGVRGAAGDRGDGDGGGGGLFAARADYSGGAGGVWLHVWIAAGDFSAGADDEESRKRPGNLIGMLAGFVGVAILSGLPWDLANVSVGAGLRAAGLAGAD